MRATHWALRYGTAVAAVSVALLIRHWLHPLVGTAVPFSTLYGALAVATYYGGIGPGAAAAVVGYVSAEFFFVEPCFGFSVDAGALGRLIGFAIGSFGVLWMGNAMTRARRRAEESTREAQTRGERAEQSAREKQQALEALRATEGRLAGVLQSDIAGIAFWRPDGSISETNDAFLRLLGYTREDLQGGRLNWREATPPEWADVDARAIVELQTSGVCRPFEKEYFRKDGSRLPVLINGAMFADGQEGVAIIVDMTERKALEAQLQQRAATLAEADRRKDEFLATLAHELRNPLAPIRSALQLWERAGDDPSRIGRYRTMMQRQVNHMVRLVDDLLDVSRITRGKVELRRGVITVAEIVESAVEASRPAIEVAGHHLDVSLPATPVIVQADGTRLSQVLSNLLNNSAKFTAAGGRIKLSAAVDPHLPTVITFCVADNGHGIEPRDLPRVFEMFTQLGSPGSGGLGIGLSLVKGLVELHGGQVDAKSDGPGKGSTFIVRLPCVVTAAAAAKGEADGQAASEGLPPAARRVLIVDDNEDAATSLSELLTLIGHKARVAHDGRSGLAVAAEFAPDVVLLDLGMPGMTGFDVAAALRADPRLSRTTLVALTGWGQEDDRRRTQAAGFDHHLVKPPDAVTLERLLRADKRN